MPGDVIPAAHCPLREYHDKHCVCWLCRGADIIPKVIHERWVADGKRRFENEF
jgi:hypothetical protein